MTKQKKPTRAEAFVQLRNRYFFIGSAIGAYFGAFFRPVREMNLLIPFALSIVVVVVMLGLNFYQGERHSLVEWSKKALKIYVKYVLVLLFLELRHPVFDAGGRAAVLVLMTIGGGIAGIQTAYEQRKQ